MMWERAKSVVRALAPEARWADRLLAYAGFMSSHGRRPSSDMSFNDELYRIKTTDEILDPLRVFVTDKEFVKVFVKATVGDEFNVPTIGVLHSPEKVAEFDWPVACCIKPTHLSGEVIIRRNGEPVDVERIRSWFRASHYRKTREANYRHLKAKVIVEPLVFGDGDPRDYKIFCVNGAPKLIQVDIDRHTRHTRAFFTVDWHKQSFSLYCPLSDADVPPPPNLVEMLAVARKLSVGFGFIRVDLYSDDTRCLVGELTNCHGSASQRFVPQSAEKLASGILFTPAG